MHEEKRTHCVVRLTSTNVRSEQLRAGFVALLGETWPLRAAVLLETEPGSRAALHEELIGLANGDASGATVTDAARRALVEALQHGDRPALLRELDEALLGVRERRPLHVVA